MTFYTDSTCITHDISFSYFFVLLIFLCINYLYRERTIQVFELVSNPIGQLLYVAIKICSNQNIYIQNDTKDHALNE